jgi:hypothetical protein
MLEDYDDVSLGVFFSIHAPLFFFPELWQCNVVHTFTCCTQVSVEHLKMDPTKSGMLSASTPLPSNAGLLIIGEIVMRDHSVVVCSPRLYHHTESPRFAASKDITHKVLRPDKEDIRLQ